jgi:small subunit ribosomal protein S17
METGQKKVLQGEVVSTAMDKTVVVKVERILTHPRYKKIVRRSKRYHAHDEANTCNVGDVVRIMETRPVSKTKRWRLSEIIKRFDVSTPDQAKVQETAEQGAES